MRYLFNIIFGIKPKVGKYIIVGMTGETYTRIINESDITDKGVWIHWHCFESEFFSYRKFHTIYKLVS